MSIDRKELKTINVKYKGDLKKSLKIRILTYGIYGWFDGLFNRFYPTLKKNIQEFDIVEILIKIIILPLYFWHLIEKCIKIISKKLTCHNIFNNGI